MSFRCFGILSFWDFDTGSKDAALASVVGTFLRPIEVAAVRVERYSNAPFGCVRPRPWIALACVDESFKLGAIEIDAHDSHSLAIRPIKLAILLIQLELLWRMGGAFGNNRGYIGAVEVRAHNGSVIRVRDTHVGPVNVASIRIDDDAIRKFSSFGDDRLQVRAIGSARPHAPAGQIEKKQAAQQVTFVAGFRELCFLIIVSLIVYLQRPLCS